MNSIFFSNFLTKHSQQINIAKSIFPKKIFLVEDKHRLTKIHNLLFINFVRFTVDNHLKALSNKTKLYVSCLSFILIYIFKLKSWFFENLILEIFFLDTDNSTLCSIQKLLNWLERRICPQHFSKYKNNENKTQTFFSLILEATSTESWSSILC